MNRVVLQVLFYLMFSLFECVYIRKPYNAHEQQTKQDKAKQTYTLYESERQERIQTQTRIQSTQQQKKQKNRIASHRNRNPRQRQTMYIIRRRSWTYSSRTKTTTTPQTTMKNSHSSFHQFFIPSLLSEEGLILHVPCYYS